MLSTQDANLLRLTRDDLRASLEVFLQSPDRPKFTMNFYQLDGYLCALVGSRTLMAPETWLPLIFADRDPIFKNTAELISISNALISFYNYHVNQVINQTCILPCDPVYPAPRSERLDIEQWARGFLQGYILVNDYNNSQIVENQALDENIETLYDEMDDMIAIVSAVADAEYAAQNGATIDDIAVMFNQLPAHVVRYGQIASKLRQNEPEPCVTRIWAWPKPTASLVWNEQMV